MESKRVTFNLETAGCGLCRRKNEEKLQEASAYCKTCREFLCTHCLKTHRRLVATENHQLLNRDHVIVGDEEEDRNSNGKERDTFEEMKSKLAEDIARLSSNALQEYEEFRSRTLASLCKDKELKEDEKSEEIKSYTFTENCNTHPDEYIQFYCKLHKQLCCGLCKILHHRLCLSQVKFIPDAINESADNEDPLKEINEQIAEFKEYDKSLQSDARQLKKSRETFLYDLKVMKSEVINWVNLMEVRAIRRLEIVFDKCKRDLELKRKQSKKACDELRAEMYFLKEILVSENNDTVDKFIKTKKANKVVRTSIEKRAHRLFTNTRFALKLNADFETLKHEINHLYELRFEIKGEDKFNIRLKDDKHASNVTGCIYLPNGDIALTDKGNAKIKIFNNQMKPVSHLSVDGGIFDVTTVGANSIAVTSPLKSKIHIVEYGPKLEIIKTIDTGNGTCWGVKHHDDMFVVNVSTHEFSFIRVINLDSLVVFQTETKCNFFSTLCIGTESPRINIIVAAAYVDGYDTNVVHCIEEYKNNENDDIVVSEYNYLNHLHIKGVSLDGYKNIVVCCQDTDQIYTIARTGEEVELLLAESDGLCKPQALCYNEDNTKLIVTSENTDFIQIFTFDL